MMETELLANISLNQPPTSPAAAAHAEENIWSVLRWTFNFESDHVVDYHDDMVLDNYYQFFRTKILTEVSAKSRNNVQGGSVVVLGERMSYS